MNQGNASTLVAHLYTFISLCVLSKQGVLRYHDQREPRIQQPRQPAGAADAGSPHRVADGRPGPGQQDGRGLRRSAVHESCPPAAFARDQRHMARGGAADRRHRVAWRSP